MWLLPTIPVGSVDYGIFSQCDTYNNCISFSIRNSRIVLAIDSMNASTTVLSGSTIITNGNWVHITVVYDATLFQQRIYVNGKIDAVSNGIVN